MMLKIGLCVSETIERNMLQDCVHSFFKEKHIEIELHTYSCGEDLLKEDSELNLLFLDMEMPGIGGIEAGRRYHRKYPDSKIILVSKSYEKIKEALLLEPCHFVEKPISEAEISAALDNFLNMNVGYSCITVYKERKKIDLLQKDICFVRSFDSYSEFFTADDRFRSEKSLNILENELENKLFFRIDRKHIVNFKFIDEVDNNNVVKIGDKSITISRRRKNEFMSNYRRFNLYHR